MDYLAGLRITHELLTAIGEIDEFKGRWEALGNLAPERLSALKRIATIESVGSSTRIEGVTLTDEEVERLLSGLEVNSFRSRDEQEVAGYADVMELIFESCADMELSEHIIRQLHGMLLRYSEKDGRHRGKYKTVFNNVEAFDEMGRSIGIIFKTASPFDTPRLMETLIPWTNDALKKKKNHPLLVIATFVVRFLAIHPFQDGNGRLSRALTTLLLLRAGYLYVPYSSLERIVEDSKNDYYQALRRAQSTLDVPLDNNESQLVGWTTFFVRILKQQKDVLAHKIKREKLMTPLAPLSEKILALVREHGRVTVRDAQTLTQANRNTVKEHLKSLVNAGHLQKRGQGRGTWYEKK